ncbi:MAG TPA: dihydrofolate reductase family protein [Nocardioides sp.]|jgi:riboflavin biosynthesis pyrimidine reductase|nr:dihydrofolate reductase family protein [Nocardioides sp.]
MRVLIGDTARAGQDGRLGMDDLESLYAAPSTPWLRVNMVSTLDGAVTGESGRSGAISNDVDRRVFDLLRTLADVVVVGAGTARVEGYRPADLPIVVVSRSGRLPEKLRDVEPGRVILATCQHAPELTETRKLMPAGDILLLGSHRVDLPAMRRRLEERGFRHILCEGGPHLLRDLLDQGVVDELDATVVPRLVSGLHPRVTDGPPIDVPLRLSTLLEESGTLLGRWLV